MQSGASIAESNLLKSIVALFKDGKADEANELIKKENVSLVILPTRTRLARTRGILANFPL